MTTDAQSGAFCVEHKDTLLDKLRRKLFPYRHCQLPEASAEWKDCMTVHTTCVLSFTDRIRAMLTGRIEVTSRTVTENEIGSHTTASEVYVRPPAFMDNE